MVRAQLEVNTDSGWAIKHAKSWKRHPAFPCGWNIYHWYRRVEGGGARLPEQPDMVRWSSHHCCHWDATMRYVIRAAATWHHRSAARGLTNREPLTGMVDRKRWRLCQQQEHSSQRESMVLISVIVSNNQIICQWVGCLLNSRMPPAVGGNKFHNWNSSYITLTSKKFTVSSANNISSS